MSVEYNLASLNSGFSVDGLLTGGEYSEDQLDLSLPSDTFSLVPCAAFAYMG